ncbi:MAG TPA: pentapeptide repeat-containing protein, partial [Pseudolabrys sp.]|nr:pentapeptide repeat-containing protein [Pseudolabrys sp.]
QLSRWGNPMSITTTESGLIKFDVLNRFSGAVNFTAEIKCAPDELPNIKLGLAVKWAIKAGAYLTGADLAGADLIGAYLAGADLTGADLTRADLTHANLAGANLTGADLTGAYLTGADLAGADLTGAYLTRADLTRADLAGAELAGADLAGAKDADLAIAKTRILPEGDLIGWKKCHGGVIVKLRIPAEAKRSHAWGRKCRAEYVDVIEVIGAEYGITCQHGPETHYRVGERIKPDDFDDHWSRECSNGIHFFITRLEAENY